MESSNHAINPSNVQQHTQFSLPLLVTAALSCGSLQASCPKAHTTRVLSPTHSAPAAKLRPTACTLLLLYSNTDTAVSSTTRRTLPCSCTTAAQQQAPDNRTATYDNDRASAHCKQSRHEGCFGTCTPHASETRQHVKCAPAECQRRL